MKKILYGFLFLFCFGYSVLAESRPFILKKGNSVWINREQVAPQEWTDPNAAYLLANYRGLTNGSLAWLDESGLNNHATAAGVDSGYLRITNNVYGKTGSCMWYYGTSSYDRKYVMPSGVNPSLCGSVSMWVCPLAITDNLEGLFYMVTTDGNHQRALMLLPSGGDSRMVGNAYDNGDYQFQFIWLNDGTFTNRAWHHWTLTWTNNYAAMYKDGILVNSDTSVNLQNYTYNQKYLGAYYNGSGSYCGYLADVRIYSIPISSNDNFDVFQNSWQ